jgi:hypothetical protein
MIPNSYDVEYDFLTLLFFSLLTMLNLILIYYREFLNLSGSAVLDTPQEKHFMNLLIVLVFLPSSSRRKVRNLHIKHKTKDKICIELTHIGKVIFLSLLIPFTFYT